MDDEAGSGAASLVGREASERVLVTRRLEHRLAGPAEGAVRRVALQWTTVLSNKDGDVTQAIGSCTFRSNVKNQSVYIRTYKNSILGAFFQGTHFDRNEFGV